MINKSSKINETTKELLVIISGINSSSNRLKEIIEIRKNIALLNASKLNACDNADIDMVIEEIDKRISDFKLIKEMVDKAIESTIILAHTLP